MMFFEEGMFLWWAGGPLYRDIKAQAVAGEDQQAELMLFHQPTSTPFPSFSTASRRVKLTWLFLSGVLRATRAWQGHQRLTNTRRNS